MTHDLPNKANRSSRFPWTGYIGPVMTWASIILGSICLSLLPSNRDYTETLGPVILMCLFVFLGGLVSMVFLLCFWRRGAGLGPVHAGARSRKKERIITAVGVLLNLISLGAGLLSLGMFFL